MKRNWKEILLWGIVLVVIIPLIIACLFNIPLIKTATQNEWIGFWGSYIGTLIGSAVTLLVLWSTLEDNRRAREREEKINYYNSLIETMATYIADVENYLISITRVLKVKGIEPRNLYVQARNRVTKSSNTLNALLCIKMGVTNIDNLIVTIKEIEKKIDELDEDLNTAIIEQFKQSSTINDIETKRDVLSDELNDLVKKFPKLIKEELEK